MRATPRTAGRPRAWVGAALLALGLGACGVEEPPPATTPEVTDARGDTGAAAADAAPLRVDHGAANRATLARIGHAGVHGRLLNAAGEPAGGARVFLLARPAQDAAPSGAGGAPMAEASVIEDGSFALPAAVVGETPLVVWALHPSHVDWSLEVVGGLDWVDLGVHRLQAGRMLRGRVAVAGGDVAPPEAVVSVEADGAEADAGWKRLPGRERGITARARPDGGFELGPLPAAGRVTVGAVAPGFRRALRRGLELSGTSEDLLLELEPGTSLRGRVQDATGAPIARARVEVWPQDSDLP